MGCKVGLNVRGWCTIVWAVLLPFLSNAQDIKRVLVIFGDGTSDQDNYYKLTSGKLPLTALYSKSYPGRPTNGKNWVDWLVQSQPRTRVVNFAYLGSTTNAVPKLMTLPDPARPSPYLEEQVARYKQLRLSPAFRKAVAGKAVIPVVWAGHLDVLLLQSVPDSNLRSTFAAIGHAVADAAAQLVRMGYERVIVATLLPLDQSPLVRSLGKDVVQVMKDVTHRINTAIKQTVAAQTKQFKNGQDIIIWDINAWMTRYERISRQLGFKHGPQTSCIKGDMSYLAVVGSKPDSVCSDPSDYLFHDPLFLSSRGNALISKSFVILMRRHKLLNATEPVKKLPI